MKGGKSNWRALVYLDEQVTPAQHDALRHQGYIEPVRAML